MPQALTDKEKRDIKRLFLLGITKNTERERLYEEIAVKIKRPKSTVKYHILHSDYYVPKLSEKTKARIKELYLKGEKEGQARKQTYIKIGLEINEEWNTVRTFVQRQPYFLSTRKNVDHDLLLRFVIAGKLTYKNIAEELDTAEDYVSEIAIEHGIRRHAPPKSRAKKTSDINQAKIGNQPPKRENDVPFVNIYDEKFWKLHGNDEYGKLAEDNGAVVPEKYRGPKTRVQHKIDVATYEERRRAFEEPPYKPKAYTLQQLLDYQSGKLLSPKAFQAILEEDIRQGRTPFRERR